MNDNHESITMQQGEVPIQQSEFNILVPDEYQSGNKSVINFIDGDKPDTTIKNDDKQEHEHKPKAKKEQKNKKDIKASSRRVVDSDYVYGQPENNEQLLMESFSAYLFKAFNEYKNNNPDATPGDFFATFIA
jgi:hypothetical protein